MAIRNIRTLGDEILRKEAKEITEMTPRIQELIDDMFETMYEANGVGLAAPQVGGLPSGCTMILSGLMSRWIMPCSWTSASACMMGVMSLTQLSKSMGPFFCNFFRRVSPSMKSMTM